MEDRYLIFGGTGSLGRVLTRRFLAKGSRVTVFSRDEAKHHAIRIESPLVESIVGDVRNPEAVLRALYRVKPRYVINAAAMKQIPICEDFPHEALLTNTIGTQNLVHAVEEYQREMARPLTVLSVSTDKACKPVSAYGMTKALQERIHLHRRHAGPTVFTAVRYGNVLDSAGSVLPVFRQMIHRGETLTITDPDMTRFLLSMDEAVDLIELSLKDEDGGTIFIPKVVSARIQDLAECFLSGHSSSVGTKIIGVRPGEKKHEVLISEDELPRTEDRGNHLVIHSISSGKKFSDVSEEYSSEKAVIGCDLLTQFLIDRKSI